MEKKLSLSKKPFPPLQDSFGRTVTYVRLSVTDRCNLRCRYCMPAGRIQWLPKSQLLSWEELFRLIAFFKRAGVSKFRFTGGEPFVRNGLLPFLVRVREEFPGLALHLTTNGVLAAGKIEELAAARIDGINVSLDSLQRRRFAEITGRDELPRVLATIKSVIRSGIPLKINTVVKDGWNTDEILPIARLAERLPAEVRFIEEMPALGGSAKTAILWTAGRILARLREAFPQLQPLPPSGSTAMRFQVPGWPGTLGVIAGHSRLFCATCNRLRITAAGVLKTCLYDSGVLNVRDLLRQRASDEHLYREVAAAVRNRKLNGFESERERRRTGAARMVEIGG
ncbi:MAG TPA: GTP 3',8-cyclase MoaA [Bacteroidetes bacterium]|nr:GTP 3',8-cyclase MoaA [Bacteroidota bacterium]